MARNPETGTGLSGRVAIITGAADGIGEATAQLFAAAGAKVVAVDRDGEKLRAAHAGAAEILCLEQDVSTPDSAQRILEYTTRHHNSLDILVNNAGVSGERLPIAELPDAVWDGVMGINIGAMFRLTRAAIPLLRLSRGGRVINLSSSLGLFAVEAMSPYITSKHAIIGFTRSLALEIGRDGITANYIIPGMILTGQTRGYPQARLNQIVGDIALGRLGMPLDIAKIALFLASEDAAYVTGQGIVCDGGWTVKL